jgi:hypothetical protein
VTSVPGKQPISSNFSASLLSKNAEITPFSPSFKSATLFNLIRLITNSNAKVAYFVLRMLQLLVKYLKI